MHQTTHEMFQKKI